MAIFEKTSHTKALIDDTETLSCTVENAQNINKHTVSDIFCFEISYGLVRRPFTSSSQIC